MRFYWLEEKLGDWLDAVPWRWLLGPLLAWALVVRGVDWLVWHGY